MVPVVLSIAGSDSGAGAGIQADLKTFMAHQVYGVTVITAITAQNTCAVKEIFPLKASVVGAQLDALFEDFRISAIKIGMLYSAEIVKVIAEKLSNYKGFIVLDPVWRAGTGKWLQEEDALQVMLKELFPIISLLTPNAEEAALLYGKSFSAPMEIPKVFARLVTYCPQAAILLKGAHLVNNPTGTLLQTTDWLWHQGKIQSFTSVFIGQKSLHGTGCTLSSAIAARVAQGFSLPEAVRLAKEYVYLTITRSMPPLGKGRILLNHLANFNDDSI
ncbi:MAG: bifunctional hydroxymethylpyrimidine kinase/phosphomethylpyrimidine kinase [Bacteroidia bacterium]|nr:bifunctional hydroxymethylpyrimidine kinase/phosphomethylpyrimidine kinase [Bacteroidia bacterium]MDW8158114.1 bifunctional hydroxymethylpyrimidine kinase/phosphomethylpyrimidine kinase [Bacteroidia bacterium]